MTPRSLRALHRHPLVAISSLSLAAIAIACGSSSTPDGFTPPAGGGDDSGTPTHDSGAPQKDSGSQPGQDSGGGDDDATTDANVPDAPVESGVDAGPPVDTAWTGRPPAVPLLVRSPYLSTWSAGDAPNGVWPTFWAGGVKAITGIARIDGSPYTFMGLPTGIGTVGAMTLVKRALTPTKTTYVMSAGGVELTIDFLSPVEVADMKRQSAPVGYVQAHARSTDGAPHPVSVYFDISGEWAHGDSSSMVTWKRESVAHTGGNLTVQSVAPQTPGTLAENRDYSSWGTSFIAGDGAGMTAAIGQDSVVRAMATKGPLDGSIDANMPRAINNNWPVFALDFDLGSVTATATNPVTMIIGHAREPAVSYLTTQIAPLWKSYWSTWEAMVADEYDDVGNAVARAAELDQRIVSDALNVGGPNYAAICTMSLRQAYGGTELVGTTAKPWMMLKEISSDGNVSTVDVVYPASPVFLYTNPTYLKLLLDPLLDYAETGGWPKDFAEHDIGSSYPNAAGHNDGKEEDMPIEESADMLLMMAGYVTRAKPADAAAYATAHYTIAKKWADYLVPNTLDPVNQNQTDDFTGFINHSANLALKGILGVGAMGVLAKAAGNTADATSYSSQAQSLITQWVTKAQDPNEPHLMLEYDIPGSWSLKYNAFYDRVLGLNLVPSKVLTAEAAWYASKANTVGVPLDERHTYTKTDWELWTAASIDDKTVQKKLIDAVFAFATTSSARVPFSDWYDTVSGQQQGFVARPVVGGHFTLLVPSGPVVPQ
jgi:hypothetical protein